MTRARAEEFSMLGVFRDERGSTAVAVVLSIVLAVTLMALCLQSYWVKSSSTDIQAVADYGALAGADAVAKASTVIQVLDALLLSMNVVGLLLNITIVVGGIAAVVGAPVGGTALAPVLTKLTQFNQKFLNVRKQAAQSAFTIAKTYNSAAPVLAVAQSWDVIRRNSAKLNPFGNVSYTGAAFPLPFEGSVTLSGYPPELSELAGTVTEASQRNRADAEKVKELEAELEKARIQCFEADVYRASGTSSVGWNPAFAGDDYLGGLLSIAGQHPPSPLSPLSIEGSDSANARLAECFQRDIRDIGQRTVEQFQTDVERTDAGGYLSPVARSAADYLEEYQSTEVLIVPHDESERRAYHRDRACFGLISASQEPEAVALSTILGNHDHPPCSLCRPLHWSAVEWWQLKLTRFSAEWQAQVLATLRHEQLRRERDGAIGDVVDRTEDAFGEIVAQARGYLLGGRLTYSPPGANGFLCVVSTAPGRTAPRFTLGALTGTAGKKFGRQYALSGAKIVPTTGQHASLEYLQALLTNTSPAVSMGMGGGVNELLGRTDGLTATTNPLWRACLGELVGRGGLKGWFSRLPWGIGAAAERLVGQLLALANISPPDLRQLSPVLVSAADVGDPGSSGPEGGISRSIRGLQQAYITRARALSPNIGDELAATVSGVPKYAYPRAYAIFTALFMGKSILAPFYPVQLQSVNESAYWMEHQMSSVLSGITGE